MTRDHEPVTDHMADAQAREDEWLAVRCQLGERAAFDDLIRRWNDPIWRYLRRLSSSEDDALEMTQEVWLRVVRGIARLREGARLRAWLFGIARRVAMDRLRHQYAAPRAADVDVLDFPGEAAETGDDDLAELQQGLDRLPVVEREVLTLFYLRELSMHEVADIIGVPVGTVKSRLFRARHLLRRELTSVRGDQS